MTVTNKLGVLFSSGKDNWMTPSDVFGRLHQEFVFTIDIAADDGSRLLRRYFGPGSDRGEDALAESWDGEIGFLNPPYSRVKEFVAKAAKEAQGYCRVVMLIPARTDTRWWHDYIWDEAKHHPRPGVQVRFIRGRLKFIDPNGPLRQPTESVVSGRHAPNNSAPFPSVVVVFQGNMPQ